MKRPPLKIHVKKGALHKQLGIAQGKKIPASTLEGLKAHGTALQKKRANFAINARKWHHGGKKHITLKDLAD